MTLCVSTGVEGGMSDVAVDCLAPGGTVLRTTSQRCAWAFVRRRSGSGSVKKTRWSERTASSTSSSSIMKLMLISLAPCEIMRTLMCETAEKTRAGDAVVAADVFADEADEGLAAFVFDVGDLASSAQMAGSCSLRINREGDGDFGGGDHVDGALEALSKTSKTSLR